MKIGNWTLAIRKEEATRNSDEITTTPSDLPGGVMISNDRELLFRQAHNDQHALWKTYNRYYTGARYVGYLSWAATTLTAIIGAILLALVSGTPGWWIFTESVVTLLLVAVSLLSAFYSPQARSVKYYRAGQDLQAIYDEYENFVNLEITDLSKDIQDLREEFAELHRRRHLANQGAPQLSGIWYQLLNWLFSDGLLSKFVGEISTIKNKVYGFLSPIKNWLIKKVSFWSNKDETGDDHSNSDENSTRYEHNCGTEKKQWQETLCEKIINHGHPPAYSERSGE